MRRVYFVAGLICVGLGALGAALPLLPTVPFLLLAVFFFARSNPAWEQRLLDHETFGPQIRDWRERKAISRRSKVIAIASIAVGAGLTWYALGFPWAWISIAVLVLSGSWIATRNE